MKTLEGMVENAIDRKAKKWLVSYARIPTYHNTHHTATVEAADRATARELVKRRLNDLGAVKLYVIEEARRYDPPDIEGKILSMG